MSESPNVVPIFVRRVDRGNPGRALNDFMAHADLGGPGERRVVWYSSHQRGGPVRVLISWEAQCTIARSTEMTTDEIFGRHAGDFDRQIALMIASRPPPADGLWTFDADDVVPII